MVSSTTLAAHRERLPRLRAAVASCRDDAARCTEAASAADERFPLANGVETHVSYAWLRNGAGNLAKAKPEERAKLAAPMLDRLGAADDPTAASPVATARARAEADRVLAEVEFAETRPGFLRQQWDRFWDWLDSKLAATAGAHNAIPWLRVLLEVALFGVPLLLLGLWLLRQVREDTLRPASIRDRGLHAADHETSWAEVAQGHARDGEWREAVHALYWQAITGFEQRRIWSVTRHRTPRDYVRLLEAGSRRRTLLRELTLLLEGIWYGHAPAGQADFERARHLTEELSAA